MPSQFYALSALSLALACSAPPDSPELQESQLGQVQQAIVVDGASVCFGRTEPGQTDWLQHNTGGVKTDVDTSACEFVDTPIYFASLGGISRHWSALGTSSIYAADNLKFRMFVRHKRATPEIATDKQWHVNWEAYSLTSPPPDVCVGRTVEGNTNWVNAPGGNALELAVDTSHCNFNFTPNYITSLSGRSKHWTARGSSSIVNASPTGFRVRIEKLGFTAAEANQRDWVLNYKAHRGNFGSACVGNTTPGNTGWTQVSSGAGISVNVDLSQCGFSEQPVVLSSLGGNTDHWEPTGQTSIYQVSPTQFRLFLLDSSLTPEFAEAQSWHVNFSARALPAGQ